MKIAIIAFSGHGKTSFMMSALGSMIDSKLDGISVDVRNGNDEIDKKTIKNTYKRLKEGLPIDNTFKHSEFWVTLKIGYLFKKSLELRWADYPGGDMIDTKNIGRIRDWIIQSDGAIMLYDLSRHSDEQIGVLETSIASIRSKVGMKPDYPVTFAMTKSDLVGPNIKNEVRGIIDDMGGFIESRATLDVTTKSIPNAHVALLKILRMVLANELKMLNNRLHDLYRYDPDTFGARLANRKNIRETESMIEELGKIDGTLERAMRM